MVGCEAESWGKSLLPDVLSKTKRHTEMTYCGKSSSLRIFEKLLFSVAIKAELIAIKRKVICVSCSPITITYQLTGNFENSVFIQNKA